MGFKKNKSSVSKEAINRLSDFAEHLEAMLGDLKKDQKSNLGEFSQLKRLINETRKDVGRLADSFEAFKHKITDWYNSFSDDHIAIKSILKNILARSPSENTVTKKPAKEKDEPEQSGPGTCKWCGKRYKMLERHKCPQKP